MIFKNDVKLKKIDFENEKELQTYFDKNLDEILNLDFVDTEFAVGNYRIDSVAFDKEISAFRIIEYKNVRNRSLVDQGFTYLKILHERKADFVLRYNEVKNESLKINDVDWSQSRIIFVSPYFSNYQIDATSFKNMPFDLYKIQKYENNVVFVDEIVKTSNVNTEVYKMDTEGEDVLKEIVVHTEESHLKNKPDFITDLYREIKDAILELGDISVDVMKHYIAFKGFRNIVDIQIQNSKLKIHINLRSGYLKDPENITIDQSNVGHLGNGDYRIEITDFKNRQYIMYLIKQSYDINK